MTEKKWNELDLEGKAKEISSLIEESLPLPWHNSNPYDLKTAMTKPLEDERVDSFEKIIKRLPLPSNVSFPFKEINRSMVKIKAMPLLRKEYINTYVFNTNEMFDSDWIRDYERDLCGETCLQYEINKSYDMAKHFLEMAIKVSKECTFQYDKTYDEKQIIKKSRFFIVGEPGVGKTTFLNYLISVFGESIIESSNSILLRIDLNDAVSKNANFEKFILERFGEIYYSYFFRNGKFVFDENKLLDHFLKVRNISNRDNKKINYIKQSINKFRNGESSSLPFLKELLIFLTIEQKISYIFVFDGLDYITLDEIHTNKFDKWLQQIDNYILSSRALRGTYILTMRDVSFQKALQAKSGSTLEFWREPKKLKIIRVDLESIIDRRLDHIRKNIKEKINKWLSDKKYQYDVNRWIEQIGVKNLTLQRYLVFFENFTHASFSM
jgi:GTPase SAR1 family protein